MRFLILTLLIIIYLSNNPLIAQQIDYNKVVLPERVVSADFREKLVQLAWLNHPDNISIRKEVEIAELDAKITKREWLDGFRIQGNLNEFNIDESRDVAQRSQFLPRYNFGLTFPLGELFYSPLRKKQSTTRLTIADNNKHAKMLEVRKNVLAAYNDYVMFDEIFKIQSLAVSNAETNHDIIEEAFKVGEESYDKYTASLNIINQRKITRLQSQNDMKNAKLVIEAYIGMPLENVEK